MILTKKMVLMVATYALEAKAIAATLLARVVVMVGRMVVVVMMVMIAQDDRE